MYKKPLGGGVKNYQPKNKHNIDSYKIKNNNQITNKQWLLYNPYKYQCMSFCLQHAIHVCQNRHRRTNKQFYKVNGLRAATPRRSIVVFVLYFTMSFFKIVQEYIS